MVLTLTCSGLTPATCDSTSCSRPGACVLPHSSTLSGFTEAVKFWLYRRRRLAHYALWIGFAIMLLGARFAEGLRRLV